MLPALLSITPSDQQGDLLQRPITQPDVVGQRNIHAEVGRTIMVRGRVLGYEFAGYLFALADAVYLTALRVVRREVGGRPNREMRRQLASESKAFTPFPLGQGQHAFLGQWAGQGAASQKRQ